MENTIKKINNSKIDELILNSNNPFNSMSIQIPFSFAQKAVSLNWSDILFATDNRYFCSDAVIEYAKDMLLDTYDEEVINLAGLEKNINFEEDLHNLLKKLSLRIPKQIRMDSKKKIMYVLLKLIYENRDRFEDCFKAIEVVYDDFGCPKSIESFVRYMQINMKLDNKDYQILMNRWLNYLQDESLKYSE